MRTPVILVAATVALLAAATAGGAEVARPLPLAASYNTGQLPEGFTPQWQKEMIQQGHHLLLTFNFPDPGAKYTDSARKRYEDVLRWAAEQRLPIGFVCPEWESILYTDKRYTGLAPEDSPLVVGSDGKILDFTVGYPPGNKPGLSPFGPVKWWRQAGSDWANSEVLRKLQELYPDPPYVLMISNNEARKLSWQNAEKDKRYVDQHGLGRNEEHKKRAVGDGYIERYRALLDGLRESLGPWRGKAILGAYGASPLQDMGTSEGWQNETLIVPGRLAIEPFIWQAVSPSQYITTWNDNADYTVCSPQTDAMNLVVQQELFEKLRPDLFWEVSVWDAAYDMRKTARQKLKLWREMGQSVTPERYAGLVKWLMWIPRARVVRDFRWWHEPRDPKGEFPGMWPSFSQVVAAVDEVHASPTLARFWRQGQLVANRARQHPYQARIPEELKSLDRWFQLDCDVNPPWPWRPDTPIHVWSFAYVIGSRPKREWMVYAQAPLGSRNKVQVTVPDYGVISADASQGGAYYHVIEKTKAVARISAGK